MTVPERNPCDSYRASDHPDDQGECINCGMSAGSHCKTSAQAADDALERAAQRLADRSVLRACTTTGGPNHEGQRWIHKTDYDDLRQRADDLLAAIRALKSAPKPTPLAAALAVPEVRALVTELEGWLNIAANCEITSGVCCCGENMESHQDPMVCQHTPTDHGSYVASQMTASTTAVLAKMRGDYHVVAQREIPDDRT